MNKENIENLERKFIIILTTLTVYILLILFKNTYFNLFNLNINTLPQIEKNLSNITYQIFGISLSIFFLIKHKNDTEENFKKYIKKASIGLLTIFIYSITSLLELGILLFTKIDPKNLTILEKSIYLITCESLIIIIIGLINKEKLKKNLKDIKEKYEEYYTKYLKLYILALIIMMISNIFINKLTQGIPGNEEAIRTTLNKAPLYMFFSSVIFAPFIEEMVFRQSLKNIITNKKTFVIASGLIFGGLHVIGNINTIYDILYIIPYATPGIAFAIMLEKTDNIFVPMGIHFLHNGLLITLQMILIFIK